MSVLSAFLSGFIVLFALPSAAQDAVNLRPQWQPGQTARYEFWHRREQKTTMTFGPNTRDAANAITSEGQMTWTVDQVRPDGSTTCTLKLDWMTATLEAEGGKQFNDSRRPTGENEAIHKLLKAMTAVPLIYTVRADGSIESVKGVSQMKGKIGKDYEAIVPEDLDFIESATDLATLPYAPATLAPGGTYKADYRWTHDLGHMNQQWTYKLDSISDMEGIPVATVTGTGKLNLDVDRSEIPPDAPPIDVKLTRGEADAQVFFDMDRHEAVGRNSTDRTTIHVTMTLPEGRGQLKRVMETTNQSQVLRLEAK